MSEIEISVSRQIQRSMTDFRFWFCNLMDFDQFQNTISQSFHLPFGCDEAEVYFSGFVHVYLLYIYTRNYGSLVRN